MTRLFDAPGPRVFALPPGVDFASELAAGLRDRLAGQPPEALARVRIAVNTRRTQRALSEAFEAAGPAVFLPALSVIEEFAKGEAGGPLPIPRLTRLLALTRLMRDFLAARPALGPLAAAEPLAGALITLLDELQQERVAVGTLRDGLDADAHAAHWRSFSAFFAHMAEAWPDALAEAGFGEPHSLRAADVAALTARWEAEPPETPIIAAGSTGSQQVTAELLVAVARLPQGAVVLPGFDFAMDAAAWEGMGPDHPQFGFRRLLRMLDLTRADVRPWRPEAKAPVPERGRLLSQAMRPAPATHEWRAARVALGAEATAATGAMTLIEAPSPRREAEAAALVIRDALADGVERVALVTPDRTLGRRVRAALARWGVEPDESGGAPLALTPPGVFLTLTAALIAAPFDPATLMAALKHPLIDRGEDEGAFRRAVARLELKGLRDGHVALRLDGVAAMLTAEVVDTPARNGAPEVRGPLVAPALAPSLALLAPWAGPAPLADLVARHEEAAAALAGPALWDKAAGEAARGAMRALREAAGAYGEASPGDYPALLAAALNEAGDVRDEAFIADPRVRILGPLEARAQSADVMILGGLNEGTWPQTPPVDPWLSRPMRAALGLPAPERRIGLSAHDFLQAASAPRVVLTRAQREGGAPTVEARWLTRLSTLLAGVAPDALAAMRARGADWLDRAAALDAVADPCGEKRPAPKPPVDARPRRISVTEVERLIRDPYDVYARRVLRLEPLGPIRAEADARLRGEALHEVMERFVAASMTGFAEDPGALFDRIADEVVAGSAAPAVEALAWRRRLARVRDWFLAGEAARRAAGAPLGVEVAGEMALSTSVGAVTLRGRADRVDRGDDCRLAIYDYKAGGAPTQKQADIFAKQLPLLAAMAAAGALEGVPAAETERLAYLSLSGTGEGGKETGIEPEPDALARLCGLLDAFFDPDRPYLPRAYVERQSYPSDFEHLSRYGEWSDPPPADPPPGGGASGGAAKGGAA